MSKTVTMRLDEETYAKFLAAARAERRSLSNLIETAALRHLQDVAFTDEAETREILANPELVRRLDVAHEEARERKGRFVGEV